MPPLRGELEMAYFGREQLAEFALPDDDSYDVKSFPIILFLGHSALHGCRSCFCPREEWGNLEYHSREHGDG
jgi:hypothetical protein